MELIHLIKKMQPPIQIVYYGTSDMVGFNLGLDMIAYVAEYDKNIALYVHSSFLS